MPKTYLTREMRLRENLAVWIYGQMRVNGQSQRDVANSMGLSQAAVCKKIKRQSFSFDDFIFFLDMFQPDKEKIMELVGANEWTRG